MQKVEKAKLIKVHSNIERYSNYVFGLLINFKERKYTQEKISLHYFNIFSDEIVTARDLNCLII